MRRFCQSLLCLLIATSGAACSRNAAAPGFTLRDDADGDAALAHALAATVAS